MGKAIFPASFNPIHNGHIDIARRATTIFDTVIVAVYDKPQKKLLFSPVKRFELAQDALADFTGIEVTVYSGLTVDFAQEVGAIAIIRGLRVFSDFEYEFRMALANKRLNPTIEYVCLMASEQHMHIASSTVVEIASLGGDVSTMVPPNVNQALVAHFNGLGDDGG
ncbi:MAG: pantetheine-phosphate adenylyltransferase [Anaerolineae bacterium]